MKSQKNTDFEVIRKAMAAFDISPHIKPGEHIGIEQAFFPDGHRGILDKKRQLVVGNRGMGKSFWTHALLNPELRQRLAKVYGVHELENTEVQVGFNGSEKIGTAALVKSDIQVALKTGIEPEAVWKCVFIRASQLALGTEKLPKLEHTLKELKKNPSMYSTQLSVADEELSRKGKNLLVVFDALDRLAEEWDVIGELTKALLSRAIDLQSFRSIYAKIFIRVDQFGDGALFTFRDSSKIKNDHVSLTWQPHELYGLLLFELQRDKQAAVELKKLAQKVDALAALPVDGKQNKGTTDEQVVLINAIAGEFMGSHKKRGRVYTWVPLHLGDAANACSPRTFLTAWQTAANHHSPPQNLVVDHLGLTEGVRRASTARMEELQEDYPWVPIALKALREAFVPIGHDELLEIWREKGVRRTLLNMSKGDPKSAPPGLASASDLQPLLKVMKSIGIMEARANGKINVPDIFRVEAGIRRKGGVAVPKNRNS